MKRRVCYKQLNFIKFLALLNICLKTVKNCVAEYENMQYPSLLIMFYHLRKFRQHFILQRQKLVSMSLSSLAVVFVSFVLTIFSTGTTYALNHSGAITSSETWTLAGSPHIVTGAVDVRNGATLTIEPGCVVKFDSGKGLSIGLFGAATLNAVGTSVDPPPLPQMNHPLRLVTGKGSFLAASQMMVQRLCTIARWNMAGMEVTIPISIAHLSRLPFSIAS